MRMKKFQKNDALSQENIIVNKKLYLISIKYGRAEEAAKAHNSLDSMAEVFHAKRVGTLVNALHTSCRKHLWLERGGGYFKSSCKGNYVRL